jgi:hypothetical protein
MKSAYEQTKISNEENEDQDSMDDEKPKNVKKEKTDKPPSKRFKAN